MSNGDVARIYRNPVAQQGAYNAMRTQAHQAIHRQHMAAFLPRSMPRSATADCPPGTHFCGYTGAGTIFCAWEGQPCPSQTFQGTPQAGGGYVPASRDSGIRVRNPAAGDTWWEQGLPPSDQNFYPAPSYPFEGKTLDPAWVGARTRYVQTTESGAHAFQVKFSALDQNGKWWICLYERPAPNPYFPLPQPHHDWILSGCVEYSAGAGVPAGGQQVGDLQIDPKPWRGIVQQLPRGKTGRRKRRISMRSKNPKTFTYRLSQWLGGTPPKKITARPKTVSKSTLPTRLRDKGLIANPCGCVSKKKKGNPCGCGTKPAARFY